MAGGAEPGGPGIQQPADRRGPGPLERDPAVALDEGDDDVLSLEAAQLARGRPPEAVGRDLRVEARGIAPVPESNRYGGPGRLFTVWFAPNLTMTGVFTGTIGVTLGLGLRAALAAVVLGTLIGAVPTAYLGTWGSQTGAGQLPLARLAFGRAVALPAVGVMDMLRYHKFSGGVAWATEYGSADDPKAFAYLFKYSPLHNLKPGTCYPATLVVTADHDDRVVPSHSFKFAAALQAAQGCSRPTLIRVETQGSHGYSPTDKRIAELADEWAFALANMKPRSGSTAVR